MPRHFVTGAAGFVGSTLVDRLLAHGHEVVGYDNLSSGREAFLEGALSNTASFRLEHADTLDACALTAAMRGSDVVWHLQANADVRHGLANPRKDLEQNTLATSNVLEAMRRNGVKDILFASSGSVYGEAMVFPTPEDAPFPVQTSLYGASKLAGEALISAYCEGYGFRGVAFRFVSMLGERYTHGHVYDFVRHLSKDPGTLRVLGDGRQRKGYLYVGDSVEAMLLAWSKMQKGFAVYNIGGEEYSTVLDSIAWISAVMGVSPELTFTGGDRGWAGDNPFIFLDAARIMALGWRPTLTIKEAVGRTVSWLLENPKVLEA
ncbi:MAG: NAD-dependent epimerase/dehydratase family protein [Deltaproteobacteria bacterium]|jgi:UDP-glucose 4-epimerase|nr:NAD-dependent epimerase/dehydratase family protein [Deltaproteobacteria bacterium]